MISVFSLIAIKKLNKMIKRDDFVAVSSIGDGWVVVQYKNSFQTIDKYGLVTND